ncbi:transcriptional regulator with XRE-family HTH domain [Actinoplanes octamycinicus]|uniref:Transcriptional regulator with XRE-family HTH domain n=1 Tax=Actinoplanes octamycinicus TaxID=135948 RepID=A0A7W7H1A5_9ACTN|nr:helix-turn-helix transcriptional regulator [Actinoplanes octamycinicus]MBB4742073.1 transcriptional regulator with XRE-family HTH domain [Actinoplanes octamycinicus]GIE63691.1 DNA-binding protein [Actinoplanes octamycinicus]
MSVRESEIGAFLRARRAAIRPEQVGLPVFGRRRVPGLRREELAQLAGVSPDYYIRLEQGRSRNVSDAVLDSIARVLGLDRVERQHLFNLARPRPAACALRGVRPGVQLLLDLMETVPAFVLGRRMDVLAFNALGDAVNGFSTWPLERRNIARQTFLDPAARTLYPQWEAVAADTVAFLHLDAGRHPGDPLLAAMIGELSIASPDFARLWAAQRVREKTSGTKVIRHPLVGEMEFGYETLALPGEADQVLVTYTAPVGSSTHELLRLLASWTAPAHPEPDAEQPADQAKPGL